VGDEKKLFPKPRSLMRTSARERELNHLRMLAATISLISFSACGEHFINTPACRTSKSVAMQLGGSLFAPDGGYEGQDDGGWLLPDGGTSAVFILSFDYQSGGITLPEVIQATNVTHYLYEPAAGGSVGFQPVDAALPVEFRFTATCGGAPAVVVRATLVPNNGSYDVTFADVP
jgi:hypothetical protein